MPWIKNGFDIKITTSDTPSEQAAKITEALKKVNPDGDVEVEFIEEIDREDEEEEESGE